MHFSQIQQKVGEWHERTFGKGPELHENIIQKLDEELGELETIHDKTAPDSSWKAQRMELADIVILCMCKAALEGIDLEAAVLEKYNINLKRKYTKVNGVWKGSK